MANTFRLKRGTTVPLAGNLVTGELAINTTDGTLYTLDDGGNVVLVGNTSSTALTATVRNETGATLAKGTVVYISGASGNKALVSKSLATSEGVSAGTYGLLSASIANNNNGTAVIAGIITGLDTSAYVDGDKVYLSPTTAGTYTTTKPSAPNHLVYIGVVTRSHANQGTIQLRIQNGFELEELHNVALSSAANNDLLVYESSTSLWKNKSIATLDLLTATTAGTTYAPLASPALTGNVTITTNSVSPALVIVQDGAGDVVQFKDVSSDTTYSFINASGKVNTIATTTANAGLNIPHGTAPTSPVNGDIWTTTSGVLARINSTTQTLAPINSPVFTGDPQAPTPSTGDNDTSIATTAFVKAQSYITSSSLTGYALLTGASALQVTGSTIRSLDAGDNFVQLNQTSLQFGNLSTGVSAMAVAGTGITFSDSTTQTTAGIADAPSDGSTYGRNNGAWSVVSGGGSGTLTYSSPYIYDNAGAVNIDNLNLGSGTLTASIVDATSAKLDSTGLVLVPSSGAVITFPDTTTQSTAGMLSSDNLSGLADNSTSRTNLGLGTLAVVNDAPSDTKAYVRKDGAWLALVADIPDFTWYDHPHTAWTTAVANSGVAATSVYTTNIINLVTSTSVANSRASVYTSKSTSVAGYVPQFYGNVALGRYRMNWSRKIALSSTFNDGGNGINANVDYYAGIGLPYPANFVGTFTDKGIGININTTATNVGRIRIIYHDGSTQKASSWFDYNAVLTNNIWSNNAWTLYSDGAGTIKLFCYSNAQNGLVATVTDGPTGVGATNNNVNIGASILTGATASQNTICMIMPRVYYGL
jgi:hypothetical protein